MGSEGDLGTLVQQMQGRVIAHVDMDAFYCQVEQRLNPELKGKPMAVVQYNPKDPKELAIEDNRRMDDSDGSLIAVSYEARAAGVKRIMRGKEARKTCPDLVLIQVPVAHQKSDIDLYRQAGAEVVDVLTRVATSCERASIDEVYVDITEAALKRLKDRGGEVCREASEGTWVAGEDQAPTLTKFEVRNGHSHVSSVPARDADEDGWWKRCEADWSVADRMLAAGAIVVGEMRAQVTAELGFTCSAGVSHNKILAKLGSGLHKPNQQTILPLKATEQLMKDLPVSRLKGLGGQSGTLLTEQFGVETVADLLKISLNALVAKFGDSSKPPGGIWIYRIARGICLEPVKDRELAKSRGTGKDFFNTKTGALKDLDAARYWMTELMEQLMELLVQDRDKLGRVATSMVVHFGPVLQRDRSQRNTRSRNLPIRQPYNTDKMVNDAMNMVARDYTSQPVNIGWLFLSAGNFEDLPKGMKDISTFFAASTQKLPSPSSSPCTTEKHKHSLLEELPGRANPPLSPSIPLEETNGDDKITQAGRSTSDGPDQIAKQLQLDDMRQKDKNKPLSQAKSQKSLVQMFQETPQTNTSSSTAKSKSWVDESNLDPSVLSELPESIQAEIRTAMKHNEGGGIKLSSKPSVGSSSIRSFFSQAHDGAVASLDAPLKGKAPLQQDGTPHPKRRKGISAFFNH